MSHRERQIGDGGTNARLANRGGRPIVGGQPPFADSRGFTLIELLAVIAVIALLMAILLPVLSHVRKQAKAMICQGHLRQWGMTLATYTQDHQGRLPSSSLGIDGLWFLRGALLSGKDPNAPQGSFYHFHTQDVACCPLAMKPSGSGRKEFSGISGGVGVGLDKNSLGPYSYSGTFGSSFVAWEITTPAPAFRGSYGLNQWLFRGLHTTSALFSRNPFAFRNGIDLDVLALRGRADIPVLLDANGPLSSPTDSDIPLMASRGDSGNSHGVLNFCMNRHGVFVNGLFLDWSVRKVELKELWTLPWYAEFNRAGRWTKAGGAKPEDWPEWMRNMKDY